MCEQENKLKNQKKRKKRGMRKGGKENIIFRLEREKST